MKLVIVTTRFDPAGGGAERSVDQMVCHLRRRGHEVRIITGSCPRALQEGQMICWPGRSMRSAAGIIRFAVWARKQLAAAACDVSLSITTVVPADVLQPRGGSVREAMGRNIASRRARSARGLKRALVALSPKWRVLLSLERQTLSHPALKHIVAISGYVRRELHAHYGFPISRMTLIPNAAQMPAADPEQQTIWSREIRQQYQLSPEATVYLFAAHNPRLKGLDPLLEAIAVLRKEGLACHLLLAGNVRRSHRRRIAVLGLEQTVRVLGMASNMPQLYCAADVTVLPTFHDAASKVTIESMMMGTPAITTSFNGAADLIDPGPSHRRCGLVIGDPSDVPALVAAMRQLADPQDRDTCSAAAADLRPMLSMDRHVGALEQVLREVAGR